MKFCTSLLLLTLAACNQKPESAPPDPRVADLQKTVAEQGSQIDQLWATVTSLNGEVNQEVADRKASEGVNSQDAANIIQRLAALENLSQIFKANLVSQAAPSLDLTGKTYSYIPGNMGSMLVTVEDASPYLDGYKLKLKIGNPSNMWFVGAKLEGTIPRIPPKEEDGSQPETKYSTVESEINETLVPGYWTPVEMVIPQVTVEDLKGLSLSVACSRVILRTASSSNR